MGNITVASTTNTQEEVNQAAGYVAEQVEAEEKPKPGEEVQSEEIEAPPSGKKDEKRPPSSTEKKIDKLTARMKAAEERATAAELRAEELAKRPPAAETKPIEEKPASAVEKPTPDKFTTYEEYVEALSDWKLEQKLAKMAQDEEKQAAVEYEQGVKDTYNKHVEEAKEKYEDWEEAIETSAVTLPVGVGQTIIELENGPDVAYYLAKHPEEAQKLTEMSQLRAIAEIGRISDRLTAPAKEEKPASSTGPDKAPIVSKAPAPIPTLKGHGTKSAVALDELPYDEYRKVRDAEQKNRFRR